MDRSRFVVLPLPFESTTTFGKGTKFGPRAILEASRNMEWYDEELGFEPCEAGIHTTEELYFPSSDPESMIHVVGEAVTHFLQRGKTVVCLGGEHSVTVPAFRSHFARFDSLGIVQLDAHADLRDSYEGTPHSHACTMRRISESTHRILQVGLRSLSMEEARFLESEATWPVIWARETYGSDEWMDRTIDSLPEAVYLTVDVDGFDPSLVPSTGTPEPGGLQWYPTLNFLRKLCTRRRVVGFDVVELAPDRSGPAPEFLAARLTHKIMGYILKGMGE
jgi:agmatinase